MANIDDPREQLVVFGQELLDREYDHMHLHEELEAFQKKYPDPENQTEEEMAEGIPEAISLIIRDGLMHEKLDQAKTKYMLLRRTLEALDKPREEMPSEDHTQDPRQS